jgi:hypothetical protein
VAPSARVGARVESRRTRRRRHPRIERAAFLSVDLASDRRVCRTLIDAVVDALSRFAVDRTALSCRPVAPIGVPGQLSSQSLTPVRRSVVLSACRRRSQWIPIRRGELVRETRTTVALAEEDVADLPREIAVRGRWDPRDTTAAPTPGGGGWPVPRLELLEIQTLLLARSDADSRSARSGRCAIRPGGDSTADRRRQYEKLRVRVRRVWFLFNVGSVRRPGKLHLSLLRLEPRTGGGIRPLGFLPERGPVLKTRARVVV